MKSISNAGDLDQRVGRILSELRSRGQRVTPQRAAIIRLFLGRRDHPSADDIHRDLQAEYPMVALSTVYSTLSLLVEMGEAVEVPPEVSRTRFDPDVADHCHLICLSCGAVIDVPPHEVESDGATENFIRARDFHAVRQVREVYGYCAECAGKA
jgi:Fur family peroxide stress response transcriptional regulator